MRFVLRVWTVLISVTDPGGGNTPAVAALEEVSVTSSGETRLGLVTVISTVVITVTNPN